MLYLLPLSQRNINNQRNKFQKIYVHIQLLICTVQYSLYIAGSSKENICKLKTWNFVPDITNKTKKIHSRVMPSYHSSSLNLLRKRLRRLPTPKYKEKK